MEYPDKVSVYHKLRTAGEDHFLLDVISTFLSPISTGGQGTGVYSDDG